MRAALLRSGHMAVRDDVPEPSPGPIRVLVEVKACGICGSDLHFASHGADLLALTDEAEGSGPLGAPAVHLDRDVFMGHELAAEVDRRPPAWAPTRSSTRPTRRRSSPPGGGRAPASPWSCSRRSACRGSSTSPR